MSFCRLCDLCHHADCFYRIFAHCGLSGKHDRITAVVDRICHITGLCSGRTRIADHRIQHLCCSDNRFTFAVAFVDDLLLDMRNLVCRDLHAEIPSCNHDAVCRIQDLINIFHTFCIFDLGNNTDISAVIIFQDLADIHDAVTVSYKGGCDIIHTLFNTKQNIFSVFLCHTRKMYFYIWNIDAFSLTQLTAVFDDTLNLVGRNTLYFQTDQTVIDQDRVTLSHIVDKLLIGDGTSCFIAFSLFCIQCKFLSLLQRYFLAVFEKPGTNLRSFRIQHQCNRNAKLFGNLTHQCDTLSMFFVASMRKIETCHVHSACDQFFENDLVHRSWSHCTVNLCFLHYSSCCRFAA